jgi:hypothetical protein
VSGSSPRTGNRPWRRARYRAGQFFGGLKAHVTHQERSQARAILPPDALALFDRLPLDAQRHSFNVLHSVHAAGFHEADLDSAALLHDVGKLAADEGGVRLGLWLRGPLVLAESLAPSALVRIASADPAQGWRYSVYVHREHPRIGAEWAEAAGCTWRTCWLIRHHQDAIDSLDVQAMDERDMRLLEALQVADGSH